MTKLGLIQGQFIGKTDRTLVSKVNFCEPRLGVGCDVCIDLLAPPFVQVEIRQKSGGTALEDFDCDSCLTIADQYVLEVQPSLCDYNVSWCQCDVPQQGAPLIFVTIEQSGSDVIVTANVRIGGGFDTENIVFDVTIPGVSQIDCQNLDLTLAFKSLSSPPSGALCGNWSDQEIQITSVFFHEFENRFDDCPFCVWETSPDIMEFRLTGGVLTPLEDCSCDLNQWVSLTGRPNCCEWAGSTGPGLCAYNISLTYDNNRWFLRIAEFANFSKFYDFVLEPDPYPADCTRTVTLDFFGTSGAPAVLCDGFEDVTAEIRPVQTSTRFKSFSTSFTGSLGGVANFNLTHSNFSTSYVGGIETSSSISQIFSSFDQDYIGSVIISGDTSQEFKSFEQSYLGGQGSITSDLGVIHSSFSQSYSGTLKAISKGVVSLRHSSFSQGYSGKVITKGNLSVSHSSFNHNYTGKVIVSGDLAVEWTSFEQQYIGTLITDPCAEPGSECIFECQGGGGAWVEFSDDCNVIPGDCICGPAPPGDECVEFVNEGELRTVPCVTGP